jgi:hypothetical protein
MLTQALASLSKGKMRDALEFAEELELELEMMVRVRRALRRIEVSRVGDVQLSTHAKLHHCTVCSSDRHCLICAQEDWLQVCRRDSW